MPRKRKRPDIAMTPPPPVTASDVLALFKEATSEEPYPSGEWCDALTEVLNHHLLHADPKHLRSRENATALTTSTAIRKAIDKYLLPLDPHPPAEGGEGSSGARRQHLVRTVTANPLTAAEYNALEAARRLDPQSAREVLTPILRPNGTSPGRAPPIWEACALISWHAAGLALEVLGRHVGTDEESVAVRFAVLATRRLGFATITENALMQRLKKHEITWVATAPTTPGEAASYRDGVEHAQPKPPPSSADINRANAMFWGRDED